MTEARLHNPAYWKSSLLITVVVYIDMFGAIWFRMCERHKELCNFDGSSDTTSSIELFALDKHGHTVLS